MKMRDAMQHLAGAMTNRYGSWGELASALGVSDKELDDLMFETSITPTEDPYDDAMVFADIIRELIVQISPDRRTEVFAAITDGYCTKCGSDFGCACDKTVGIEYDEFRGFAVVPFGEGGERDEAIRRLWKSGTSGTGRGSGLKTTPDPNKWS